MLTLADNAGNSMLVENEGMILLDGSVVDPVAVSATHSGADVVLTWGAIAGAATYTIQRAGMADVTGVTDLTQTDAGAANGPHVYTVLALDAGGNIVASGQTGYQLPGPTIVAGNWLPWCVGMKA